MQVHRRLNAGLAVASLVLVTLLAGCSADDPPAPTATAEGPRTVTLRVTGTGWPTADVSVTADDTATPIATEALPWSKELDYDSAATLWLFAVFSYIPDRSSVGATLSCEILVDGKSVSTVTARSRLNDAGDARVEEHAVCSYTPGE